MDTETLLLDIANRMPDKATYAILEQLRILQLTLNTGVRVLVLIAVLLGAILFRLW